MDDLERFEKICRAMAASAFYPHPVEKIERCETHISVVFLTGSWAYKLKKPMDFGFLDYTSLAGRKRMCELEVTLNQRLAKGIYAGVVPVRRGDGGFSLGGPGEIVEYAVKMRQLPDEASLSRLLFAGQVRPEQMEKLGEHLGNFYRCAERTPAMDEYGRAEVINVNTEENFRQLEPFVGVLFRRDPFDSVRESSRAFFRDHGRIFQRRIEEGRIRDGHGDLRAEHVYFLETTEIIDCIEFNERFRYGDAAADLAYLYMDIERLGHPDLALRLLDGYVRVCRDHGLYTVLDFYSCYRALVKLKVSCLTWTELGEGKRKREMESRAVQYLLLAFRYAVQFSRPAVWVLCGLPGTGKSAVAGAVREALGIALYSSDETRREMPEYGDHAGPEPYGRGIYRAETRGRVYARLLALAQEELKKGRSVILDATFSRRKWREEALMLADDRDANIFFIECTSPEDVLIERLSKRRTGDGGRSDARSEHLAGLSSEFESMEDLPASVHAGIDTAGELEASVREALLKAHAMKRLQVEELIERL
ncbi:MAG: AAA family ATPase [Desulfobacteraceae bacterium]|nr:AAA family ATPase [Desulfobacteraceae bacterium]